MKFYLASSFKFIDKVDQISKILEEHGHEITEKWWCRPYQVKSLGLVHTTDLKKIYDKLTPEEFYSKPETRTSYFLDKKGVKNCDAFILISSDNPRKFNGANIELGIADAYGKRLFSIGRLEKSVLYYPVVKCKNIHEVLKILEDKGPY